MKLSAVVSTGLALMLAFSASLSAAGRGIVVVDPHVREVPPGQPNSAAFMVLKNKSDKDRVVISADSDVAEVVELHTHTMEDGMMKMRQIDSIKVPAGGETVLKPGGLHVMLIGLKAPLAKGQQVAITLNFKDGSSQRIVAPVRPVMRPMGHGKDDHHPMMKHNHGM